MDNNILSIFSRFLGFSETTDSVIVIFLLLFFVIGFFVFWGGYRINEYTKEFYLSEIMPATPLEKWWSGLIFGSKLFLTSSIKISVYLLFIIGVIQILLSCIFFVLGWLLTVKLSNSGFFIINLVLGMIVSWIGYRLHSSSLSLFTTDKTNQDFGFQYNKFWVSIAWLLCGLLLVYFFSEIIIVSHVSIMAAVAVNFLVFTVGMFRIYTKSQKSENGDKLDKIRSSGYLQTETSDHGLNEILRKIELESKPVIKRKIITRPADMPWRLSKVEDPPSEEEKEG
jgi:hypothetical protein